MNNVHISESREEAIDFLRSRAGARLFFHFPALYSCSYRYSLQILLLLLSSRRRSAPSHLFAGPFVISEDVLLTLSSENDNGGGISISMP